MMSLKWPWDGVQTGFCKGVICVPVLLSVRYSLDVVTYVSAWG